MILSVAMIVRDESNNLARCLESIKKFNAQIVILDTGSVDDTVEIAKRYTNEVYFQKWQDNYSLHRNKSFSYCKGDWIMQIDADEQLCFKNGMSHHDFLYLLTKIPKNINAIGMVMKDWRESLNRYAAEFDVVRVFRNGSVKYKRRVHNEAVYEGKAHYAKDVYFKHYGYDLTAEQQQKKARRTIPLLEKSIEDDPTDYESYFYLAQAHASWTGNIDEVIRCGTKYLEHKADLGERFNPSIYHLMINIYMKKKEVQDLNKAMEYINLGLQHDHQDIDVSWDLIQYGLETDKPELIAAGAQRFVNSYKNLKANRFKDPGRFFFNNNEKSYTIAQYYLTIAMFECGTIEYRRLKKLLENCDNKLKMHIEEKLHKMMTAFGWKNEAESRIITPADFNRDKMRSRHASIG